MKDIILSLSGGLDSASFLYCYKERIKLAVSFKYPSNHNKIELKYAKRLCKKTGIPHKIINVTQIFKDFKSSLLSGADKVPNAEYNKESISSLVVPFRNGIFLSILAGLAESYNVKYIGLASHSNDSTTYPDCTKEFSDAFNTATQLGTLNKVEFFAPFVNKNKGDVAYFGITEGLNPDDTYSCYKGFSQPCGECPTCKERKDALIYAKELLEETGLIEKYKTKLRNII